MTRPHTKMGHPDPWTLPGLRKQEDAPVGIDGPGAHPDARSEKLANDALRERLDGMETKARTVLASKASTVAQQQLARDALRFVGLARAGRYREAENVRAAMMEHHHDLMR